MLNNYLFFCLAFLLFSCAEDQLFYEAETVNLTGEYHSADALLAKPANILALDNFLIIFDDGEENIFKVYSLDNLKYLYSTGEIGEGPTNWSYISYNSLQPKDGNKFSFLDDLEYREFEVAQDSFKTTDKFFIANDGPVNGFKHFTKRWYMKESNRNISDEKEFVSIQGESGDEFLFGDFPKENIKFDKDIEKRMFYLKHSRISLKNKRIFVFYYKRNAFKVFDLEGEVVFSGEVPGVVGLSPKEEQLNGFVSFGSSYATEGYVYALWVGKSRKDVTENLDGFRPKLLKFDWDGQLKGEYALDAPVHTFAVSRNDEVVYACNLSEDNKIVTYVLDSKPVREEYIFTNNFFKLRLPLNWEMPERAFADSTHNLIQGKRNKFVRNVFRNTTSDDYPCGASIHVDMYFLDESEDVDQFVKVMRDRLLTNTSIKNMQDSSFVINEVPFFEKNYDLENRRLGTETTSHHRRVIWKDSDKLFSVTLNGCEDFEGNLDFLYNLTSNNISLVED
jgi:hypothetical protein